MKGWRSSVAGLVALGLLLAGCSNEFNYTYKWGEMGALRRAGLFGMGWWFGRAERSRTKTAWPKVFIELKGKRIALERVSGDDLARGGFDSRLSDTGRMAYGLEGAMFLFERGLLIEWRQGPDWDDKHGPLYYPSATASEGFQFPLTESEVDELFGPPDRKVARRSIN